MASPRTSESIETEIRSATRFQRLLIGAFQTLIGAGMVAGIGAGFNTWINSTKFDYLELSLNNVSSSVVRSHELMRETAVINAVQTRELEHLHESIKRCREELDRIKEKRG